MHRSSRTPARPGVLLVLAALATVAACAANAKTSTSSSGSGDAGTGEGGGGGGAGDDCAHLCAAEAGVTCPNTKPADCVAGCEVVKTEVAWCTASVTPAIDCLAKEPSGSFQCDKNGQTAPKSGVCVAEQTAMADCWYDGPPGGLPDQTQACSGVCALEALPSCTDPNCNANCLAGVKAGMKCNGAFAALVTCAAKQDASSFACDMEMPPRANLKPGFCSFEELLLLDCLQQP